jgi:hypothetical protein
MLLIAPRNQCNWWPFFLFVRVSVTPSSQTNVNSSFMIAAKKYAWWCMRIMKLSLQPAKELEDQNHLPLKDARLIQTHAMWVDREILPQQKVLSPIWFLLSIQIGSKQFLVRLINYSSSMWESVGRNVSLYGKSSLVQWSIKFSLNCFVNKTKNIK